MANSTIQLQFLVDDAASFAELAPALAVGGFSDAPALSIANDVMREMVAGGPEGQPFNWKWNRVFGTSLDFFTNSWQQDYFISGLVGLGWLESCTAVNFSNTQFPKPVRPVEVRKDLLITNAQNSNVGKICWMQNDTMITGVWGQSTAASTTGLDNPGPSVTITSPTGLTAMPKNPINQVKDAFGNLWLVTTYGVCGGSNPFLTNLSPVFPTFQDPSIVATTVSDGTVVWTAINPKGQGFRINPIPGQTGPIWLLQPVAQSRIAQIKTLSTLLDPIPDDYYPFFKQGFFTQCYRRSPDPKVRAKFPTEYQLWMKSLDNSVRMSSREMDDFGFYPASNVMETGTSLHTITPALPYGGW